MKIIIASDSFKGSLPAIEIGETVKRGLLKHSTQLEVLNIPMADGGEGTVDALVHATGGKKKHVRVFDPLMREIDGHYGVLGNEKTAVIEMAIASGLPLLEKDEYNPLVTNTFGTGQLIKDALDQGCREFIIGIGGSATNDGGMGMLQALGVKFLNKSGDELTGGGLSLIDLHKINVESIDSRIKESKFEVACDVQNPLCGPNGASYIYGPQKGATEKMVEILDSALMKFAQCIKGDLGIDVLNMPGAGAAGGLGAGLLSFLGAELRRGIDIVIEKSGLEAHVSDADIVITGEGKLDYQTQFGKTPYGVAKLAKKYSVPVIAICGGIDNANALYDHGVDSMFSIVNRPMSIEEAMANSEELLESIAYNIIKLIEIKDEVK